MKNVKLRHQPLACRQWAMLSACLILRGPRSPWHSSTRAQGQWQHENEEPSRLGGTGDAYRREPSHKATKAPKGFFFPLCQSFHLSSTWLILISEMFNDNVWIDTDTKTVNYLLVWLPLFSSKGILLWSLLCEGVQGYKASLAYFACVGYGPVISHIQ